MTTNTILAKLRILETVPSMLWLSGGVAVDFLVGAWTRPHKDLDLLALSTQREALESELSARAFHLVQDGPWLTHWSFTGDANPGGSIEIIYVEPREPDSGQLRIQDKDAFGAAPGLYPFPEGALSPRRFAQLDGQRFRVCSPGYELFARKRGLVLFPQRKPEAKVFHDMRLLEGIPLDAGLEPPAQLPV